MKTSRTLRSAAAALVVLSLGVVVAQPGTAATAAPRSAARQPADGLESSVEDRVRAAAVVGVVAPDSWLVLNERDFVFALWQRATELPEVRASAELALMNSSSTTSFVECTVFIESGIHDAKARDVAEEVRDATAAREAREVKQRALVTVEIPVTPELLLLADREFVYAVYQRATGTLVRAGALAAFGGTAQQQREFISTGIGAAREQDRRAEIEADQERTEAERQALFERDARKRAAAVLMVAATEGMLVLSDENFVRWVWNNAEETTEVYAAAMAALRSTTPADWRAYIHTGIHTADRLDREAELRSKGEADRRLVTAILTRAESEGRNSLARAARAALAGSDTDVNYFLRVGQYQVSANECANPVLATDQAGWGPLGSALVTTRQAITDHGTAKWEFSLANGTATTAGIFLPQQKVLPGAVWDVSVDARTLNDPARIRMEVDWYSATGTYLGHTNGGYLPVSGQRAFTRVAGRFTAPASAGRANLLVRATDLAAGGGFTSTMCTYEPNLTPDVKLTATPGNGTVSIAWTTTRTDITGWNVGRDGTDTRGNGPWATDRPADARTHQFNLLTNETSYSFTVIPQTAAGPLTPVTVSAKPTANPGGGTSTEAAVLNGWGTPLPEFSDEFDYVGAPSLTKWSHTGECETTPHHPDARRCASASTVDGEKLVMKGTADGRSGWLGNKRKAQYGRWEARVRSRNTAGSNGNTYHPLLIVFPSDNSWPDEGEYDFLENGAPGEACAEAWLHYPHPNLPVQQVGATEQNCGAPLSEWHNIAFEWTSGHIRGLIDGKEWFRHSGGANSQRRAIQTMNSGRLTIQLDNFDGRNMTPASYEVDWVRVYNP
jgi:hypothetical protein